MVIILSCFFVDVYGGVSILLRYFIGSWRVWIFYSRVCKAFWRLYIAVCCCCSWLRGDELTGLYFFALSRGFIGNLNLHFGRPQRVQGRRRLWQPGASRGSSCLNDEPLHSYRCGVWCQANCLSWGVGALLYLQEDELVGKLSRAISLRGRTLTGSVVDVAKSWLRCDCIITCFAPTLVRRR